MSASLFIARLFEIPFGEREYVAPSASLRSRSSTENARVANERFAQQRSGIRLDAVASFCAYGPIVAPSFGSGAAGNVGFRQIP